MRGKKSKYIESDTLKIINSHPFLLVECCICHIKFWKQKSQIEITTRNCCSRKCVGESNRNGELRNCEVCNCEIHIAQARLLKSKNFFCNKRCSGIFRRKNPEKTTIKKIITDRFHSYRKDALNFYGPKCQNPTCIISGIINIPIRLLDVDHINSDRKDSSLQNLQVLCVFCHAIKTRKVSLALDQLS